MTAERAIEGNLAASIDDRAPSSAGKRGAPIVSTTQSKFQTYESGFKIYEDGKHRRYELLFAVNGGAFVIAKLFAEGDVDQHRLGLLNPKLIAAAMIAYTIIMWWDIYAFGQRIHWQLDATTQSSKEAFSRRLLAFLCELLKRPSPQDFVTFGPVGKFVLALLCIMLIVAWGLVLLPG